MSKMLPGGGNTHRWSLGTLLENPTRRQNRRRVSVTADGERMVVVVVVAVAQALETNYISATFTSLKALISRRRRRGGETQALTRNLTRMCCRRRSAMTLLV